MFKFLVLILTFQICVFAWRESDSDSLYTNLNTKTLTKRSTFLPSTSCSREHISTSLRGEAPCQPRDKVIVVPWPNNTDVHQLTPTHVTVRRCSGGCHQDHQSCVASLTRTREVLVILGKCPVSGGKCEKECASVEVEDEVECACGCRRKESECGEKHLWMSNTCECECKDSVGRTQCLEGGPGRVWDSTQCECVCPVTLTCHTGMKYDQTTCSCQPSMAQHKIGTIEREERSDIQQFFKWEYVIIGVLALLLIIFLFIIISLLRRINILKKQLCTSSTHTPSAISNNLYSACPTSPLEKSNNFKLHDPKSEDLQLYNSPTTNTENTNLQLFTSSSDISSTPQCCSDKHTDSSFCSDSSDSGHTSVYRQTPTHTPTHPTYHPTHPSYNPILPTYHPTPHYQPYLYSNLSTLQEDSVSEISSLVGKETTI